MKNSKKILSLWLRTMLMLSMGSFVITFNSPIEAMDHVSNNENGEQNDTVDNDAENNIFNIPADWTIPLILTEYSDRQNDVIVCDTVNKTFDDCRSCATITPER